MVSKYLSRSEVIQIKQANSAVIRASYKEVTINNHTGNRVFMAFHLSFKSSSSDAVYLNTPVVTTNDNKAFFRGFAFFFIRLFVEIEY